ncbi:hypothetical protein LEMLEM_LOCUS9049 [Lemmus lemmus]
MKKQIGQRRPLCAISTLPRSATKSRHRAMCPGYVPNLLRLSAFT